MDLGYQWSLDFVEPLPITKRYNKYILVMIEHFSKWIELLAFLDKLNEEATYTFLTGFLAN